MFGFSISYIGKTRNYYVESENEFRRWINTIHKVTCYEDLVNTYETSKEKIADHQFGVVMECIKKSLKRKAAMKVIFKKAMRASDNEFIRNEIEILKVAQHPNIVQLYDVLENQDYIYISKYLLLYLNKSNGALQRGYTVQLP